MKLGISIGTTFPYVWKITYTSGYSSIPNIPSDVKMAIYAMVKAYWVQRQASGISSFKQDLLTVNYDKGTIENLTSETEKSQISMTVNKYKIPYTYAT